MNIYLFLFKIFQKLHISTNYHYHRNIKQVLKQGRDKHLVYNCHKKIFFKEALIKPQNSENTTTLTFCG